MRHSGQSCPAAGRAEGNREVIDTDVMTKPETDPDEPPARFNRGRILRWVAILTLGILAVLAIWQDPLYAGLS
jgi:hypothetical protein